MQYRPGRWQHPIHIEIAAKAMFENLCFFLSVLFAPKEYIEDLQGDMASLSFKKTSTPMFGNSYPPCDTKLIP